MVLVMSSSMKNKNKFLFKGEDFDIWSHQVHLDAREKRLEYILIHAETMNSLQWSKNPPVTILRQYLESDNAKAKLPQNQLRIWIDVLTRAGDSSIFQLSLDSQVKSEGVPDLHALTLNASLSEFFDETADDAIRTRYLQDISNLDADQISSLVQYYVIDADTAIDNQNKASKVIRSTMVFDDSTSPCTTYLARMSRGSSLERAFAATTLWKALLHDFSIRKPQVTKDARAKLERAIRRFEGGLRKYQTTVVRRWHDYCESYRSAPLLEGRLPESVIVQEMTLAFMNSPQFVNPLWRNFAQNYLETQKKDHREATIDHFFTAAARLDQDLLEVVRVEPHSDSSKTNRRTLDRTRAAHHADVIRSSQYVADDDDDDYLHVAHNMEVKGLNADRHGTKLTAKETFHLKEEAKRRAISAARSKEPKLLALPAPPLNPSAKASGPACQFCLNSQERTQKGKLLSELAHTHKQDNCGHYKKYCERVSESAPGQPDQHKEKSGSRPRASANLAQYESPPDSEDSEDSEDSDGPFAGALVLGLDAANLEVDHDALRDVHDQLRCTLHALHPILQHAHTPVSAGITHHLGELFQEVAELWVSDAQEAMQQEQSAIRECVADFFPQFAQVVETPGDGDCLFHSINMHFGYQRVSRAQFIRAVLTDYDAPIGPGCLLREIIHDETDLDLRTIEGRDSFEALYTDKYPDGPRKDYWRQWPERSALMWAAHEVQHHIALFGQNDLNVDHLKGFFPCFRGGAEATPICLLHGHQCQNIVGIDNSWSIGPYLNLEKDSGRNYFQSEHYEYLRPISADDLGRSPLEGDLRESRMLWTGCEQVFHETVRDASEPDAVVSFERPLVTVVSAQLPYDSDSEWSTESSTESSLSSEDDKQRRPPAPTARRFPVARHQQPAVSPATLLSPIVPRCVLSADSVSLHTPFIGDQSVDPPGAPTELIVPVAVKELQSELLDLRLKFTHLRADYRNLEHKNNYNEGLLLRQRHHINKIFDTLRDRNNRNVATLQRMIAIDSHCQELEHQLDLLETTIAECSAFSTSLDAAHQGLLQACHQLRHDQETNLSTIDHLLQQDDKQRQKLAAQSLQIELLTTQLQQKEARQQDATCESQVTTPSQTSPEESVVRQLTHCCVSLTTTVNNLSTVVQQCSTRPDASSKYQPAGSLSHDALKPARKSNKVLSPIRSSKPKYSPPTGTQYSERSCNAQLSSHSIPNMTEDEQLLSFELLLLTDFMRRNEVILAESDAFPAIVQCVELLTLQYADNELQRTRALHQFCGRIVQSYHANGDLVRFARECHADLLHAAYSAQLKHDVFSAWRIARSSPPPSVFGSFDRFGSIGNYLTTLGSTVRAQVEQVSPSALSLADTVVETGSLVLDPLFTKAHISLSSLTTRFSLGGEKARAINHQAHTSDPKSWMKELYTDDTNPLANFKMPEPKLQQSVRGCEFCENSKEVTRKGYPVSKFAHTHYQSNCGHYQRYLQMRTRTGFEIEDQHLNFRGLATH